MDTLLESQNGVCANCQAPIPSGTIRVQVSVRDPLRYELTEETDAGPGVREIPRELYERFKRAEAELEKATQELDDLLPEIR